MDVKPTACAPTNVATPTTEGDKRARYLVVVYRCMLLAFALYAIFVVYVSVQMAAERDPATWDCRLTDEDVKAMTPCRLYFDDKFREAGQPLTEATDAMAVHTCYNFVVHHDDTVVATYTAETKQLFYCYYHKFFKLVAEHKL